MKLFKKMIGVLIENIYLVLGGEIDPDLQALIHTGISKCLMPRSAVIH
jgi:hypothetical protein